MHSTAVTFVFVGTARAHFEEALAAAGARSGVGVIDCQLAELAHMHEQLARARDHRAHHPAPAPQLPPVQIPGHHYKGILKCVFLQPARCLFDLQARASFPNSQQDH